MTIAQIRTEAADPKAAVVDYLEGYKCPMGTYPLSGVGSGDASSYFATQARAIMMVLQRATEAGCLDDLNNSILATAMEGAESLVAISGLCADLVDPRR